MTRLMGIVNVTPDSFSGDGDVSASASLAHIDRLIGEGADIVDIGAESTRPGAQALTPEEEWRRLRPIMEALGERKHAVAFSVDTRHAEVARRALKAGCRWINDVSGGQDPELLRVAKESEATLAIMHSLTVPASVDRVLPQDRDPIRIVLDWAEKRLIKLEAAGVDRSRIVLDPGIGFGKTRAQSLALIRSAPVLKALGLPLLIGHSRKSFLSSFTDMSAPERDLETILVSEYLVARKVDFLRVHDIAGHRRMLAVREALA